MAILSPFRAHRQTRYSPTSGLHIKRKARVTLWIYNEQARKDSLRFEFFSPTGHVSYRFGFRLNAQGWRACWIGFAHMKGDKQENTIAGYRIVAPDNNGRVFFDRLVFP